jgi:hypothetical protein
MIPNRDEAKGQALIEFAINLIVLFIIAIFKGCWPSQGWITSHNSSGATGRNSLTGQFETEYLTELFAYLDARTNSVKDKALHNDVETISDRTLVRKPHSSIAERGSAP